MADPDRPAQIGHTHDGRGFDSFSYADFADYRDQNTTLAGIALYRAKPIHLSAGGEAERIRGMLASGNYFAVLGAESRDVLKLIVRQGMTLALIGVGAGLLASVALTRLMKSLRFGVSPNDPLTFTVIALLLTIVTLLACLIPARRATKVDPMIALCRQ